MGMQASDIADLVTTTLSQLGRNKWTDNASKFQKTVALKIFLKKGKTTFDDGKSVSFNRSTAVGTNARFVGLAAKDVTGVSNVMGTGDMPWRHVTWNYSWDYREPLMNSSESRIVDLIKTRRIAELGGAIELFERALWRVAASTDNVTIQGIPYWVVKSATAPTYANNDGFNGQVPSGYTLVGNIDPATDDKWRNYAGPYTAVSKSDLVDAARRMAEKTDWSPLTGQEPQYDTGDELGYYTNYPVYATLCSILESSNENLGKDLAPYDKGGPMLRGVPVKYIPALEDDTTNPLYQIDWGVFGAMGLRGAWMKEKVVDGVAGEHTVTTVHTDCTLNTLCRDRRKCGVLSNGTTMPA